MKTQICSKCGKETTNDDLFGITLEDGKHVCGSCCLIISGEKLRRNLR